MEGRTARIDTADGRYQGEGASGDSIGSAIFYLRFARGAGKSGDVERACLGYRLALEAWAAANDKSQGRWAREQHLTNREYASFLLHVPSPRVT